MIIEIIVKTNKKETKIEKVDNNLYKISTKSPAIENKANLEIIKILSEYFDIPQSSVRIKSGKTSSRKTVEI